MTESGIPQDVALKMAQDYMFSLKDLKGALNTMDLKKRKKHHNANTDIDDEKCRDEQCDEQ